MPSLTQTERKRKELKALAVLEKRRRRSVQKLKYYEPYPWQVKFYRAGRTHKQRMLLAANRVGKTLGAAAEFACHVTGEYPEWWDGKKYAHALTAWALGVSGEQIRDVIQAELIGVKTEFGWSGGFIRADQIIKVLPAKGTPDLAKDIHVKSRFGASIISLKSYSQGQHALMGSGIDIAWIDEEPEDPEIYPQVITRTATGDNGNGGIVLLTMTPENGVTELVGQYMDDRKAGQYLLNVTWDDAPHLTEETKRQLLEAIPEYQRDMRSKGIPLLGHGMVFPIAEERIKVDPFQIPDHFMVNAGIDFGINHPFACCWHAYDPDSDTIYVYDTYRETGVTPPIHAAAINARGKNIPIIYPHDGDAREKGTGEALSMQYKDANVNIRMKFENPDGGNKREPGIMEMYTRMQTGRFKVFSNQSLWFEEFRRYHRKDGKIVDIDDDLMSASRYGACMVTRVNVRKSETNAGSGYNDRNVSINLGAGHGRNRGRGYSRGIGRGR